MFMYFRFFRKDIYLHTHLGLGDHLITNGLIRYFTIRKRKVFLFVKHQNVRNVEFMYSDIQNLVIIPVNDDNEVRLHTKYALRIGHENLLKMMKQYDCSWDESFYLQLGLKFQLRWDLFHVPRDFYAENVLYQKLNPDNRKFVLIHNIDSQGVDRINYSFVKSELLIIFVTYSNTIFDYCSLIENAEEIHCIDSAFIHLVDSIENRAKLFFHYKYKTRTTSLPTFRSNWNLI